MTWLWAQTLVLLTLAYFIGAALACLIRRGVAAGQADGVVYERAAARQTAGQRAVEPLPEVANTPGLAARYERALDGERREPARPAPAPSARPAVASPAPPAAVNPTAPATPQAATAAAVAAAVAAVATAAAATRAVSTATSAAQPASATQSTAAPKPATSARPDDLKRIRAIDAPAESALNKLGIERYDQIARWQKADVARVDQALGYKGRIEQENWIEQAQVLATGDETDYSLRLRTGPAPVAPVSVAAAIPAALQPAPAVSAPRPAGSGPGAAIAAAAAAALAAAASATRAAQPAAGAAPLPATPAPVVAPRVEERAAFAGRTAEALPPTAPVPASTPATPAPAAQPMRPAAATRDVLQRIGGINGEIERQLSGLGVTRYAQIGGWQLKDIERFDGVLGIPGRIKRENWVEQAQILARGGDTAFSREYDRRSNESGARPTRLADAIRENTGRGGDGASHRSDIGGLRSVRSDAYRPASAPSGGVAAQGADGAARVLRSATPEDLKRIRGIGVLIEKKLNSLGVTSYGQIANWAAGDIERVSQKLDFRGRIERENWVEQARILASGGATEFSSRVDKGEVETSKARPVG